MRNVPSQDRLVGADHETLRSVAPAVWLGQRCEGVGTPVGWAVGWLGVDA